MRDKINVLYYPDMVADHTTLKKAILFFDEIHFMDRPSFSFEGGLGTIGMASPLRQFEKLFRRDNVPIYLHDAPSGRVLGDFLAQIVADVNDPLFLARFQEGLRTSQTFRYQHVPRGNYGDMGTAQTYTEQGVIEQLTSVNLSSALSSHRTAMTLITDTEIRPFSFASSSSIAKTLIFDAAVCSAKMNLALNIGSREGFTPFADAAPYSSLLGAKYARAISTLDKAGSRVPITNLVFAIFDELVPGEVLTKMTFEDVIRYRHDAQKAREEFLEYLSALQQKLGRIEGDSGYAEAIDRLIRIEVVPAAQSFQNKLRTIGESFVGVLAKGAMGAGGVAGGVQVLGDLSLGTILTLAGITSAYVGQAAVDAFLARRAATRECSLSYVLSLD